MKRAFTLLTAAVLLGQTSVSAQFQGKVYEEDTSIVVTAYSDIKKLAWCGGLNNPQFSLADVNHDGLEDVVIYQSDQNSVKTFINEGSPGKPEYRYVPKYAANFPQCYNYLVMRDYNHDNIQDLFQWGGSGISVFRGYYNTDNELCFTPYKELYYNNNSKLHGTDANAEVNPGDIPAIIDVDNDGDLDFLSYYGDGYYMNWYQNVQKENGLPDDTIRIRLADQCWGKMVQSAVRTHHLGIYCDNSYLLKTTDGSDGSSRTAKVTDGGNTPCLIDMDNDGDYDVLDGHRAFIYMVYLENGKNGGPRDTMIYQDTTWAASGDTIKMATWPAAFHCDIDQDGKRDLIVTPNASYGSENYKCISFYRNTGTEALPVFELKSDSFMIDEMIDVGGSSYPFFYDYNKDGKPDLFIGSKGYYESSTGVYIGKVSYYQNTSSGGKGSFNLITDDFLGLSARRYQGISIGIGDIDNDGKDDFLMGHIDGTVDVIKNTAFAGIAPPVWTSAPTALLDGAGNAIVTNGSSVPVVYDMNKDGINDLVIGDQFGYLFYYEADGSSVAGTANLIFTNDMLGAAKSDPDRISSGYSVPFIGKMDNSGRDYLLMGSRSGKLYRYTGFETGSVTMAFTLLDTAYSYIYADHAAYTSYASAPAIADIDADGKYDMVLGNIYGGLLLYKQTKTVGITEEPAVAASHLLLFPNPAKDKLYIALENTVLTQDVAVDIYNNMGQLILHQDHFKDPKNIKIDISGLAPSVYLCTLHSAEGSHSAAFVKQD